MWERELVYRCYRICGCHLFVFCKFPYGEELLVGIHFGLDFDLDPFRIVKCL